MNTKCGILPDKAGETVGAWIKEVGVYVNQGEGVVIAECVTSKRDDGFIHALAVDKDGSITFQHIGEDGKLHWAMVSQDAYARVIIQMLHNLKSQVTLIPKNTEEVIK